MRHLDGTHRASCGLLLQLIISHGPIQSVLSLICINFFGGLSFSCQSHNVQNPLFISYGAGGGVFPSNNGDVLLDGIAFSRLH